MLEIKSREGSPTEKGMMFSLGVNAGAVAWNSFVMRGAGHELLACAHIVYQCQA